jgi:hypothetical protein
MKDERFPKLSLKYQSEVEVVPEREKNTSYWKRVEEYRLSLVSSSGIRIKLHSSSVGLFWSLPRTTYTK